MKVFCIPGGGTPSSTFYKWMRGLPPNIKLVLLEFPGRGMRHKEPVSDSVSEIAGDLFTKLQNSIGDEDYVLLSTCIGTLIEYEIYRRIVEQKIRLPRRMIVFSADVPGGDTYQEGKYVSEKNRNILTETCRGFFKEDVFKDSAAFTKQYVNYVIEQNQCTDEFIPAGTEIFQEREAGYEEKMSLDFANDTLQMLSYDWQLAERYGSEKRELIRIGCPLTVVYGAQDSMLEEEKVMGWKDLAANDYEYIKVNGSHNLTTEQIIFCQQLLQQILRD